MNAGDKSTWPAEARFKQNQELSVRTKAGMRVGHASACWWHDRELRYMITVWVDNKPLQDGPYAEADLMEPLDRTSRLLLE